MASCISTLIFSIINKIIDLLRQSHSLDNTPSKGKTVYELSFIVDRVVCIVNSRHSLQLIVLIFSNISLPVICPVLSLPMLPSIVEVSFINPVSVSQHSYNIQIITLSMEFIVSIKSALILKVTSWSFPNKDSFCPCSICIQSFVAIVLSDFGAVPIEFIVLKTSCVFQLVRFIMALSAFFCLCNILIEMSVIKRAVSCYECAFTVSYAIFKMSYVYAPIFLIHSPKPMRNASCLPITKLTSLSYPMQISLKYFL